MYVYTCSDISGLVIISEAEARAELVMYKKSKRINMQRWARNSCPIHMAALRWQQQNPHKTVPLRSLSRNTGPPMNARPY